jgi:hypothetical protein
MKSILNDKIRAENVRLTDWPKDVHHLPEIPKSQIKWNSKNRANKDYQKVQETPKDQEQPKSKRVKIHDRLTRALRAPSRLTIRSDSIQEEDSRIADKEAFDDNKIVRYRAN